MSSFLDTVNDRASDGSSVSVELDYDDRYAPRYVPSQLHMRTSSIHCRVHQSEDVSKAKDPGGVHNGEQE